MYKSIWGSKNVDFMVDSEIMLIPFRRISKSGYELMNPDSILISMSMRRAGATISATSNLPQWIPKYPMAIVQSHLQAHGVAERKPNLIFSHRIHNIRWHNDISKSSQRNTQSEILYCIRWCQTFPLKLSWQSVQGVKGDSCNHWNSIFLFYLNHLYHWRTLETSHND